jgi:hypothetical protein
MEKVLVLLPSKVSSWISRRNLRGISFPENGKRQMENGFLANFLLTKTSGHSNMALGKTGK